MKVQYFGKPFICLGTIHVANIGLSNYLHKQELRWGWNTAENHIADNLGWTHNAGRHRNIPSMKTFLIASGQWGNELVAMARAFSQNSPCIPFPAIIKSRLLVLGHPLRWFHWMSIWVILNIYPYHNLASRKWRVEQKDNRGFQLRVQSTLPFAVPQSTGRCRGSNWELRFKRVHQNHLKDSVLKHIFLMMLSSVRADLYVLILLMSI